MQFDKEVEIEETTQDVQEPQEETAEETVEAAAPVSTEQPVKQNTQEHNIRQLRLAKEKAERENAAYAQRLAQLEQQFSQKPQTEPEYGENDFVEGKHLKKEVASVKKEFEQYKQQVELNVDETRLRTKYNDFDKVVNADNIALLREADPEFAESIASSQAPLYSRGAATYKRMKELGIYVEDTYKQEKEIAQKNLAKPRPLNSISPQQGDSPLSMANAFANANGLTPELKRQLWKDTLESANKG